MANYSSGTAAVFPVQADGSSVRLRMSYSTWALVRGDNGNSHAHSVTLDFSNRHAYVADLGTDHDLRRRTGARQVYRMTRGLPKWRVGASPLCLPSENGGCVYLINERAIR